MPITDSLPERTTPEGAIFPVDPNLRPEGRQGPLVRTLGSHLAYYDRWAKTWEFQALLKARPAAGDREAVGATMNMTRAQNRFLVTLRPGEAAVFADGMDYPLLVRMPDGTGREAAAEAATATPAGVVRPRSTTCGADCTARPCTFDERLHGGRCLLSDRWRKADLAIGLRVRGTNEADITAAGAKRVNSSLDERPADAVINHVERSGVLEGLARIVDRPVRAEFRHEAVTAGTAGRDDISAEVFR